MSGRDERKKSVEQDKRIESLTCENCGNQEWVQYNKYASTTYYNVSSGRGGTGTVEFDESSDWECDNCGQHANLYQGNELDGMGL